MRWKFAGVIAAMALCASCATDAVRPAAAREVRLPAVLHGTWEIGPGPCQLPGNPDSDSRIVIEARRIDGYEEWNEVLAVTPISTAPLAWKVRMRENYQGEVNDSDAIFSITGKDQDSLVIVDPSRPEIYVRCI